MANGGVGEMDGRRREARPGGLANKWGGDVVRGHGGDVLEKGGGRVVNGGCDRVRGGDAVFDGNEVRWGRHGGMDVVAQEGATIEGVDKVGWGYVVGALRGALDEGDEGGLKVGEGGGGVDEDRGDMVGKRGLGTDWLGFWEIGREQGRREGGGG